MTTAANDIPVYLGPALHAKQRALISTPARYVVAACGRRFGKTHAYHQFMVREALLGKYYWWLSPTYLQLRASWRYFKQATRAIPMLDVSEQDYRIALPTGGVIEVRSGYAPDNLRGSGLDGAVIDEAAYQPERLWYNVIWPMLLTTGGRAFFPSTPNGMTWFHDIFKLGLDANEPDWHAVTFTTYDNPNIPADQLDTMRRTSSERVFREEIMAEFLVGGGAVFRNIDAAMCLPPDAQPVDGHDYVFGVDWGRENDYTAIAIVDTTTRQLVALDRFNKVGWDAQRGRIAALAQQWKPATIWAEANSIGSPNVEALQHDGLPVQAFTTTAQSKAPLIEGLALAIERGELTLVNDAVLRHELLGYEMTRLPGGGYRYGASGSGHDDTVIASALAWHGVTAGTLEVLFAW